MNSCVKGSACQQEIGGVKPIIRTRLYINNIDYDTLVEMLMPYIDKALSEKDNPLYGIVNRVINNDGKPSKFSKFLFSVIPDKSNMVALIFPYFDELMIKYTNELLIRNNLSAKIMSIKIKNCEGGQKAMLKIEIKLDEIDYEKTAENLLPQIIQKLSEKEDQSGKLGRFLLKFNGLPNQVLKAAIAAIPIEERDALVVAFLSEYKEEIITACNEMITQNNVQANISEMKFGSR